MEWQAWCTIPVAPCLQALLRLLHVRCLRCSPFWLPRPGPAVTAVVIRPGISHFRPWLRFYCCYKCCLQHAAVNVSGNVSIVIFFLTILLRLLLVAVCFTTASSTTLDKTPMSLHQGFAYKTQAKTDPCQKYPTPTKQLVSLAECNPPPPCSMLPGKRFWENAPAFAYLLAASRGFSGVILATVLIHAPEQTWQCRKAFLMPKECLLVAQNTRKSPHLHHLRMLASAFRCLMCQPLSHYYAAWERKCPKRSTNKHQIRKLGQRLAPRFLLTFGVLSLSSSSSLSLAACWKQETCCNRESGHKSNRKANVLCLRWPGAIYNAASQAELRWSRELDSSSTVHA